MHYIFISYNNNIINNRSNAKSKAIEMRNINITFSFVAWTFFPCCFPGRKTEKEGKLCLGKVFQKENKWLRMEEERGSF